MLIIGIVIIAISVLVSIISKFLEDESSHNKYKKALIRILSIIGFVIGGFFMVFNLSVDSPTIMVNADKTGIYFSKPEPGVAIEYCVRTNDTQDEIWNTYKEGTVVEIHQDPSLVKYKSRFFVLTSQKEETTVRINKDGVYIIPINPSIKSISATYNEQESTSKSVGNLYAGYNLKEKDFSVIGVDRDGDEVVLEDGFSFNPTVLKEGENTIDIEYGVSDEPKSHCTVSIYAHAPKLLSLKANLKEDNDEIRMGTILTTEMFDVIGTFEDGGKRHLDDFTISPINMDEEKEYNITIKKGNIKANITINVVDPFNISEEEKENNNTIENANEIAVNSLYTGKLYNSEESDVDYYRFRVSEKGSLQIYFKHPKIDSSDEYWCVSLLQADTENPIMEVHSTGASSEIFSSKSRISPGTYYIKVNDYYHSDEIYNFRAIFTPEDDYYETETNDEIKTATRISCNSNNNYTGNIMNQNDYDYYSFSISEKGKVQLHFSHDKLDSDNEFWSVSILGSSDNEITSISSYGSGTTSDSDCIRLPKGEYYIRVAPYYWSDIDYHLALTFVEEGEGFEAEPNNDYGIANEIALGQKIIGNIESNSDVDFYFLNFEGSGSLKVIFSHDKIDSSNVFWTVRLYGTSSEALVNTDDKDYLDISGSDPTMEATWNDLDPGLYYVKIVSYYYNNDDYTISIN